MFDVQFVILFLLIGYMHGFQFLLSALTFLLPADLFLKVSVEVSPKLVDYYAEWKHLYVGLAYFTIDMMDRYTLELLSIGIPLSHPLGLFDFLLYTTLQ